MKSLLSIWETDEQFWPKAAREYAFLAAAFHEVGPLLCDGDWTGREALPLQWPQRESWSQWQNAVRLAAQPIPPRSLADYRPGREERKAPERPKLDAAKIAEIENNRMELMRAEQEANQAMIERRYKVAGWIAEHARNGELATYGITRFWEPQPLKPSTWFGIDDWALFADCTTKKWVSQQLGSVTLSLFVSKSGLDKCLSALGPPPVAGMVSAERQAESWLRDEFAKPETEIKPKSAFKSEAIEAFRGLSGEGFKRAWGNATMDFPNRRAAGAKSKG